MLFPFMQDVWSELGRPCGIHQMQVTMLQGVFMLVIHISFYLWCLLHRMINQVVWHDTLFSYLQLLCGEKVFSSSLCLNYLHISLPHGKLILSTHRPNGYSFCLWSLSSDHSLCWLFLLLFTRFDILFDGQVLKIITNPNIY